MEFKDVVARRYSVRTYKDKELTDDVVEAVIEAARIAPSASNRQEWRFIVVRDAETRKKLAVAAHNQAFVGKAPAVIAACAVTDSHKMSCGQLCYPIDVAIALEHIALAAADMGLGTCWIGAFDEKAVRQILGVPEDVRVVELMPLGYPADKPGPKTRLPLADILMWEGWRK